MRLFLIILIGISLILSLIGTITNRWYLNSSDKSYEGLWLSCKINSNKIFNCDKQGYLKSQGLSISSIILLSISFILSIIYYKRENDRLLGYFIILILLGTTLLLIFSYLLFPRTIYLRQLGYSIYLMIISSLIILVTTALVTFTTRNIQSTTITSNYLT